MNKRIRKVTSIIAVMAAFSLVEPLNSFDLMTTTAYASTYSLNDIELNTPGGSDISLYENENYTKKLDNAKSIKDTYYVKLSSDNSKVIVNTSKSNGIVKIIKDHSSKVYDEGDSIPILTGKTTLRIRVYDTYDSEKPNDYKEDYRVIIKRYSSAEEQEIINDDSGDIYLQKLEVDYGSIPVGFNRQKYKYNATVDADVKSISIKAQPEDGATTVRINNIKVDENVDYKKMVSLNKGNNEIEIKLSQDYEKDRIYTININRGESAATVTENKTQDTNNTAVSTTNANEKNVTNTNKNENNSIDTANANKWIKVLDKWRYNDSYGRQIKNTWFYDRSYGKNYYFDSEGNMATGWLNLNNIWYYLNGDGSMQTGWKQLGDNWYYLNSDGKMATGWFKDNDNKYYYLNERTGAMAHDTVIGGYKLGRNGAWKK